MEAVTSVRDGILQATWDREGWRKSYTSVKKLVVCVCVCVVCMCTCVYICAVTVIALILDSKKKKNFRCIISGIV
jgi:hypothetical protein